jgi:hypothetical protein
MFLAPPVCRDFAPELGSHEIAANQCERFASGACALANDLRIDKPGHHVRHPPFTTMLILSVVVSLGLWLMRR